MTSTPLSSLLIIDNDWHDAQVSLFAIGAVGLKENMDLRRESSSDSDSVSGFDGNGADQADGGRPAELLELTPQSSR